MEVGDDADHMRAIAKKKKDELERAAAKMRARVEAYETVWKSNFGPVTASARWRGGLRGASRSLDSSERPQNPKINHPLHGEMDTSRVDGVKAERNSLVDVHAGTRIG